MNLSSPSARLATATDCVKQVQVHLADAWLPRIYCEQILKMRTRAYKFPSISKNAVPEIHHTLLGIELKVGRQRMLCPDLATARYLAVFARVGCERVAIPYDITKISRVADELEISWHRMLLLSDRLAGDRSSEFRARVRRALIAKVRDEIEKAGTGALMPKFNQSSKQPVKLN